MGLPNPDQCFDDLVVARRWPSELRRTHASARGCCRTQADVRSPPLRP
jgi:hypothetical protein